MPSEQRVLIDIVSAYEASPTCFEALEVLRGYVNAQLNARAHLEPASPTGQRLYCTNCQHPVWPDEGAEAVTCTDCHESMAVSSCLPQPPSLPTSEPLLAEHRVIHVGGGQFDGGAVNWNPSRGAPTAEALARQLVVHVYGTDSTSRKALKVQDEFAAILQRALEASAPSGLVGDVEFLLDRLSEYVPDEDTSGSLFMGHVDPAITRLKWSLAAHKAQPDPLVAENAKLLAERDNESLRAHNAEELLMRAWRVLDIAEPNGPVTDDVLAYFGNQRSQQPVADVRGMVEA